MVSLATWLLGVYYVFGHALDFVRAYDGRVETLLSLTTRVRRLCRMKPRRRVIDDQRRIERRGIERRRAQARPWDGLERRMGERRLSERRQQPARILVTA